MISIQDDGKGFSEQDLEHAFDYLYKGADGSTGLGLSIARLIVDELNGAISLRNAEDGGGAGGDRIYLLNKQKAGQRGRFESTVLYSSGK